MRWIWTKRKAVRRAAIAFLVVLALYMSSYCVLSRRGLSVSAKYDLAGFVYCDYFIDSEPWFDPPKVRLEMALGYFYLPANLVDCVLLGGPPWAPVFGPM